MDRRQKKTRAAIYRAFEDLIKQKKYEGITVQDIIDEADIGRSTFYAHFETKDELLSEMCGRIFEHIFDSELIGESTHDFSVQKKNLSAELTHLLYHVREKQEIICLLLISESREIFMRFFKSGLRTLFQEFITPGTEVPHEYRIHHLVSAFSELVIWWANEKMKSSPETMISYFYRTNVI